MLKFIRELRRWKSFLWFLIFMQMALFYTLPAVHAAYGFPGAYNSGAAAVDDLETKAYVNFQGDSVTVQGQFRVLGNTILNGAYVLNDTSEVIHTDTIKGLNHSIIFEGDTVLIGDGNDVDTTLKLIGVSALYSHIVTNAVGIKLFKNNQEILRLSPGTSYTLGNWYPIGAMVQTLGNVTFKWKEVWGRTYYADTIRADDNSNIRFTNPISFDSADVEVIFKKAATFLEIDNGNSGTSKTIDWGSGNKQKILMTGDCTFTFTAPESPGNFLLKVTQDGTPPRLATWPGTVTWPGGTAPTLSTGSADVDIVSFYYDGTNYHGQAALDFQ